MLTPGLWARRVGIRDKPSPSGSVRSSRTRSNCAIATASRVDRIPSAKSTIRRSRSSMTLKDSPSLSSSSTSKTLNSYPLNKHAGPSKRRRLNASWTEWMWATPTYPTEFQLADATTWDSGLAGKPWSGYGSDETIDAPILSVERHREVCRRHRSLSASDPSPARFSRCQCPAKTAKVG